MRQSRRKVGLGQRALGNVAANAQVVEFCVGRAQARDGVAETVKSGQLSEGHAQKLIPARERTHAVIPTVSSDAF